MSSENRLRQSHAGSLRLFHFFYEFRAFRSNTAPSDAMRRGRIPSDWLITIMLARNVHPEWILAGTGPYRVGEPPQSSQYKTGSAAQERRAKVDALRKFSSKDLTDELLRRIAVAQAGSFVR